MTQYPTDLTEKQWQVIKNILEPQARNRKYDLREIWNFVKHQLAQKYPSRLKTAALI